MKTAKKINTKLILLSIVMIIAIVTFAILSYAWYSVSLDDVDADINVEANSVFTFEVLHAAFFTPNDILRSSVAYANNQYPTETEKTDENIAKLKYATLDVDYKIYNATAAADYLFYVSGIEIYAPGTISAHDEPMYKIAVDKSGNVTVDGGDSLITERVKADLSYSFADSKNADNSAEWNGTAVWNDLSGASKTYNLGGGAGEVYLAVKFNKYDDLIDEAIYNGLQIKVVVTMESAPAGA